MSTLNFEDDNPELMSINNYLDQQQGPGTNLGPTPNEFLSLSYGVNNEIFRVHHTPTQSSSTNHHHNHNNHHRNNGSHIPRSNGASTTTAVTNQGSGLALASSQSQSQFPSIYGDITDNLINDNFMNDDDTILAFQDIAKTIDLDLDYHLTRHLLSLIRVGVSPDYIYKFLKDCLLYSRLTNKYSSSNH